MRGNSRISEEQLASKEGLFLGFNLVSSSQRLLFAVLRTLYSRNVNLWGFNKTGNVRLR
jgi:hypothetical protein